jgi:transposase
MRKKYPSDITREQFEKIRPILESARKKTKPRVLDLYEIFCAVLYLVKSGCQWRMLPSDFPKWNTIYFYFQIWTKKEEGAESILDQALRELITELRLEGGREAKTSMIIVDSQSVKNTATAKKKAMMEGRRSVGSSVI